MNEQGWGMLEERPLSRNKTGGSQKVLFGQARVGRSRGSESHPTPRHPRKQPCPTCALGTESRT